MGEIEQAAQSETQPAEDATQPAETGTAAREPKHPGIAAIVDRWWEDHFPGSAVARHTDAWNVAHSAKETLKRLLAAL